MNANCSNIFIGLGVLITLLLFNRTRSYSQQGAAIQRIIYPSPTDSLLATEDSAVYYSLFAKRPSNPLQQKITNLKSAGKNLRSETATYSKGGFQLTGGYAGYASNYRSIIDTPFAERNIIQHNVTGQLNFSVNTLPLQATFLLRRSNSDFFRNIQDVQISLDPLGWRRRIQQQISQEIQRTAGLLDDSATANLLKKKKDELMLTSNWLKGTFQMQRLIEANEVLNVPKITHRSDKSEEQNNDTELNLKNKSKKFIDLYRKVDSLHRALSNRVAELEDVYKRSKTRAAAFRQISNGDFSSYADYRKYQGELEKDSLPKVQVPGKYERWMGIRNLGIGRNAIDYSELTARNISVNGINVEYNTWYYAALTAGLVDFRFRDFAIGQNTRKQYMVMARLGLGQIDGHHFIISAYKGYKQMYATGNSVTGLTGIQITGLSAEAKWKINNNSTVTGEIAESISPDFRSNDPNDKTRFNWSDRTNKAYAVKLNLYYPKSASRIEGMYKSTGANYQSFSSFQTNSSLNTWYIKGDQYLFKRTIKLAGSIRTSDFSNPYIVQQYSNNTVFKSVSASLRKRKWPTLSVGYMPMSQLTSVDNQITENRFQAVNLNGYHLYKVARTKTATSLMINKFYNSASDTAFVYYNATNIYLSQSIFLGTMIASVAVSDTRNPQFFSQIFDESLQFNVTRSGSLLLGVKINNFNRESVKVGGYGSANIRIWKNDMLYISYERGFLPGTNRKLARNDMATIQFTKSFGFSKQYSTDTL